MALTSAFFFSLSLTSWILGFKEGEVHIGKFWGERYNAMRFERYGCV